MKPTKDFFVDLGDGVKREIRFTLSTLKRLKSRTGKSFLMGDGFSQIDEDILPVLIGEALVARDLSEDQIADIVAVNEIQRVLHEVLAAFAGNMPEAKDSEKN